MSSYIHYYILLLLTCISDRLSSVSSSTSWWLFVCPIENKELKDEMCLVEGEGGRERDPYCVCWYNL